MIYACMIYVIFSHHVGRVLWVPICWYFYVANTEEQIHTGREWEFVRDSGTFSKSAVLDLGQTRYKSPSHLAILLWYYVVGTRD